MGIFDWFKPKKEDGRRPNHNWNEADRQAAYAARMAKVAEIKRKDEMAEAEHRVRMEEILEELRQMRDERKNNGGDNMEAMLLQLLMGKGLVPPQNVTPSPSPSRTPTPNPDGTTLEPPMYSMPDEEIKRVLSSFSPAQIQMFRALPRALQRSKIEEHFPEVDDESIERALVLVNG